jgi:hypothetical protein
MFKNWLKCQNKTEHVSIETSGLIIAPWQPWIVNGIVIKNQKHLLQSLQLTHNVLIYLNILTNFKHNKPKKNWMEGIKKAMQERNLNEGQWEDRKQWSLGVGQRRKSFETDIHTFFLIIFLKLSVNMMAYPRLKHAIRLHKTEFCCVYTEIYFVY